MRKIYLIIVAATALLACSRKEIPSSTLNDNQYNQILERVEKLNVELGCISNDVTRGTNTGGNATRTAADLAGYAVGYYFGTDIGAAVGSVAGLPGAILGGLIGKKFGGVIVSAVASFVAGEIYDRTAGGSVTEDENKPSGYEGSTAFSVGEVHNIILSRLSNNDNVYYTSTGELNITKIFDDAISIARDIALDETPIIDSAYRTNMEVFCKGVESIIYEANAGDNTIDFSGILTKSLHDTGLEIPQTIIQIYNSLLSSSILDEDLLTEYEAQFFRIVSESDLEEDEKEQLSTTGSVAIRSGYYWRNQ